MDYTRRDWVCVSFVWLDLSFSVWGSTFEIHPLVCSCHPCSFPNDPVAGTILHDNGCMYPQSPFSNMLIIYALDP